MTDVTLARCLRCMVGFGVGDGGLMPTFIYVKPLDCHIDLDIISIRFICSMTFHYGINLPLYIVTCFKRSKNNNNNNVLEVIYVYIF